MANGRKPEREKQTIDRSEVGEMPASIVGGADTKAIAKQGQQGQQGMARIAGTVDDDEMPDFLKELEGDRRGAEHITREDVTMPRLGLAQQMSNELVATHEKYIPDLKQGQVFNNVTKQTVGVPLDFTVVMALPARYIEFYPRTEGGGVKDMNVPPGDPRTQFGSGKDGLPAATKFYEFVVMTIPDRSLIVLSLKGAGLKMAKDLNTFISARNLPSFAGKYRLTTTQATNKKGTFFKFVVGNAGWVTKADLKMAMDAFEMLKGKNVVVEREERVPGADDVEPGEM